MHPNPDDAITPEEAIEVFDLMADRGDLVFKYAEDGCYARTHIMCRYMMKLGLTPGKAWAFSEKKRLAVSTPEDKKFSWWFHVAPALPVYVSPDKVENLVFDPTLFDGPVPLEEWGQRLGADIEKMEIAHFGEAPRGYTWDYVKPKYACTYDDNIDFCAERRMQRILRKEGIDAGPRVVFQSSVRGQPASGQTWISEGLYKKNKADNKEAPQTVKADRPKGPR